MCFIDYFIDYSYRNKVNFARAWICNCFILCDRSYCFFWGFFRKVRMVKLVSVDEGFVSATNVLGEEDESSVAVKETLERLVS